MTTLPATRRPEKIATYLCRVLGVVFVATAPMAFFGADAPTRYHTLLHVVTGLIALYLGFWRSPNAARVYCLAFGSGYLAFGILGILLGDPANDRMWHVGPLQLMLGDHLFHVVLGALVLLAGLVTRRRTFVQERPR